MCIRDSVVSMMSLAIMLTDSCTAPPNFKRAAELLLEASAVAKRGGVYVDRGSDAEVHVNGGLFFLDAATNEEGPPNWDNKLLEEAGSDDQDHPDTYTKDRCFALALKFLRRAHNLGSADATIALGVMHIHGLGVSADPMKGLALLHSQRTMSSLAKENADKMNSWLANRGSVEFTDLRFRRHHFLTTVPRGAWRRLTHIEL